MRRWLLIALLFPIGLASGLGAFLGLMAAYVSGLSLPIVGIAAVITFHTYLCGLTLEHLKRGDEEPWTRIAMALILVTVTAVAAYQFG